MIYIIVDYKIILLYNKNICKIVGVIMSLLPPQTINHDASSEGLIASVHVDVVKIAPKKTYSMGGHDYEGMDYHGLLVRVRR